MFSFYDWCSCIWLNNVHDKIFWFICSLLLKSLNISKINCIGNHHSQTVRNLLLSVKSGSCCELHLLLRGPSWLLSEVTSLHHFILHGLKHTSMITSGILMRSLMSSPTNSDPVETPNPLICICYYAHTINICREHSCLNARHCSGDSKMDLLWLGTILLVYPLQIKMSLTAALPTGTICSMTKYNYVPHNSQF